VQASSSYKDSCSDEKQSSLTYRGLATSKGRKTMGIYGPSGGVGGGFNTGFQLGNPVVQIRVWSDVYVHAIALLNEAEVITGFVGTAFGNTTTAPLTATIDLQSGEYVTQIIGQCGAYMDSIRILTNLNRVFPGGSGIYGGSGGSTEYFYNLEPGQEISGFFGRSGDWIDAIGVYSRTHVV
jgi:hypothetical protein